MSDQYVSDQLSGGEALTRYKIDVATNAKGEVNVSFDLTVEYPTEQLATSEGRDTFISICNGLRLKIVEDAAQTKSEYLTTLARERIIAEYAVAAVEKETRAEIEAADEDGLFDRAHAAADVNAAPPVKPTTLD
jgi:hypothetical protein